MIGRIATAYLFVGLVACTVPLLGVPFPFAYDRVLQDLSWYMALPFSLLVPMAVDANPKLATIVCILGLLINFGILRWIAARAD